jgi:hypothetical protein
MKDNKIEQNMFKQVIHDMKHTVQETNPLSVLPIKANAYDMKPDEFSLSHMVETDTRQEKVISSKPEPHLNTIMVKCKSTKVILPGQDLVQKIEYPDETENAVEPWEQNKNVNWPEPQLCTVKEGTVGIQNNSNEPVVLGKDVQLFRVRSTVEQDIMKDNEEDTYYKWEMPSLQKITELCVPRLEEIKFGDKVNVEARKLNENAHKSFIELFDKDLTGGYNNFYDKHCCKLNLVE